jgi:hypothetical protein
MTRNPAAVQIISLFRDPRCLIRIAAHPGPEQIPIHLALVLASLLPASSKLPNIRKLLGPNRKMQSDRTPDSPPRLSVHDFVARWSAAPARLGCSPGADDQKTSHLRRPHGTGLILDHGVRRAAPWRVFRLPTPSGLTLPDLSHRRRQFVDILNLDRNRRQPCQGHSTCHWRSRPDHPRDPSLALARTRRNGSRMDPWSVCSGSAHVVRPHNQSLP